MENIIPKKSRKNQTDDVDIDYSQTKKMKTISDVM
jgi:hypothetical protein